jgi:hypothetical protein
VERAHKTIKHQLSGKDHTAGVTFLGSNIQKLSRAHPASALLHVVKRYAQGESPRHSQDAMRRGNHFTIRKMLCAGRITSSFARCYAQGESTHYSQDAMRRGNHLTIRKMLCAGGITSPFARCYAQGESPHHSQDASFSSFCVLTLLVQG